MGMWKRGRNKCEMSRSVEIIIGRSSINSCFLKLKVMWRNQTKKITLITHHYQGEKIAHSNIIICTESKLRGEIKKKKVFSHNLCRIVLPRQGVWSTSQSWWFLFACKHVIWASTFTFSLWSQWPCVLLCQISLTLKYCLNLSNRKC